MVTNNEKQELRYYCRCGYNFNSIRKLVSCADSTINKYLKVIKSQVESYEDVNSKENNTEKR